MFSELIFLSLALLGAMILVENRLKRIIQLTSLHGFLLLCALISEWINDGKPNHLYFAVLAILILAFKIIATPWIFYSAAKRLHENENTEPRLGFLMITLLMVIGFFGSLKIASSISNTSLMLSRIELAYAFVIIYTGVLTFIVRTHWIALLIGFVIFENGVFILAIALSKHLPLGVELGTFVDAVLATVAATSIRLWQVQSHVKGSDAS